MATSHARAGLHCPRNRQYNNKKNVKTFELYDKCLRHCSGNVFGNQLASDCSEIFFRRRPGRGSKIAGMICAGRLRLRAGQSKTLFHPG